MNCYVNAGALRLCSDQKHNFTERQNNRPDGIYNLRRGWGNVAYAFRSNVAQQIYGIGIMDSGAILRLLLRRD